MSECERRIHGQFVEYGRNAHEWLRKCALLLPQIERKEIWRKKGFGSIYEYAAKLAGMSRSSVSEALRVLKRIEDKPELRKVVEVFGIQRVRPVAGIATAETAAFWAEKARDMSKHTLETYVREYRKEFLPGEELTDQEKSTWLGTANLDQTTLQNQAAISGTAPKAEITTQQKQRIEMELDLEIAQKLLKLKGAGDWNALMKNLLAEREEKLEQKKPQPIATKSRHIPTRIERFVLEKTNGQCAYPGCTKPHESLHHTQRFALEKIHDPDRLAPLCEEHERIAHLGLIENEEEPSENWRLRKTYDPTHYKRQVDELVWLYR